MEIKKQLIKNYPELQKHIKDIIDIQPINDGMSGSLIYILYDKNHKASYLKITLSDRIPHYLLERNPYFLESEYLFYTQIVPKLSTKLFPKIVGNGYNQGKYNFLILEDLSKYYEFYRENHHWSENQFKSILKTYAVIHARGEIALKNNQYKFLGIDIREKITKNTVHNCFKQLYENDWTHKYVKDLYTHPHFVNLIEKVETSLNHLPVTINHNDFYPLNIGYNAKNNTSIIIDWQLVGKGPAFIDLSDIGLFNNDFKKYGFDLNTMLHYYLKEYSRLTKKQINFNQFYIECRYANLIKWGTFLTNIVHVMYECNKHKTQFGDWMMNQFKQCVYAWSNSFDLINK